MKDVIQANKNFRTDSVISKMRTFYVEGLKSGIFKDQLAETFDLVKHIEIESDGYDDKAQRESSLKQGY